MKNDETITAKENQIYPLNSSLLELLLLDRTTKKNLLWATEANTNLEAPRKRAKRLTLSSVTDEKGTVLRPRMEKSKQEQISRIHDNAEVFTPSWICNRQNNLADDAWFGKKEVFNVERGAAWQTTREKIPFPAADGKNWQDYVKSTRLEIACGEAPYLVSLYDTVTGRRIPVADRIGILDRKLRVVGENTDDKATWYAWAKTAFQNVYGFEWQGDNVFLARKNLLYTFIEYYEEKFQSSPSAEQITEIATIVSWNIWQMDGLKGVVPHSCRHFPEKANAPLEEGAPKKICLGCQNNKIKQHNGKYCFVMDWETNKRIKFISLMKG